MEARYLVICQACGTKTDRRKTRCPNMECGNVLRADFTFEDLQPRDIQLSSFVPRGFNRSTMPPPASAAGSLRSVPSPEVAQSSGPSSIKEMFFTGVIILFIAIIVFAKYACNTGSSISTDDIGISAH